MDSKSGKLKSQKDLQAVEKSKVVSLTADEVAQLRHTKIAEWPNWTDV